MAATPAWGDENTVGSIDALRYLKQKATQLGKPLVINQSQGVMMGPHDGSTLFEKAYNDLINQQNIIIAVAAGNDQDAGWHARQNVSSGSSATIALTHDTSQQAGGPLPTVSFEVWYDAGKQFSYQLRTPSGGTVDIPASTGNDAPGVVTAHADTVFFYSATANPVNQQGTLDIFMLNRTSGVEGGQWQVQVKSEGGSSGVVHLYCERNQFNFTVDNPDLTSIVAMPGTATEVITVGSYNTRFNWPNSQGGGSADDGPNPLGEITSFSSNGPRRDGGQKPDLSAPGKWIVSSLAATHQTNAFFITPEGQHHALLGTSMACPHVAGAIALMLEKDPTLNHTQVKQILQQTARKDGFTGASWSPDFGHGKLDVKAAVDAVSGGGGSSCSTTPGDANLNNSVNVLDVVAMVNHILGSTPLNKDQIACADVTGDDQITVNDVNGTVGVILAGAPRPLAGAKPAPIAWGETADQRSYRLSLDASSLGGIQMCFIPPRGFELFGEPVLHGARSNVDVSWSEALGQYTLVAYDPLGGPLASGRETVTLEIPMIQTWDGGQAAPDFAITRLILSDAVGTNLELAAEPTLEPAEAEPVRGIQSLLQAMAPNPMAEATQISYRIEAPGTVQVGLFDPTGRQVRRLWNGHQMAGGHLLAWDGRDDAGSAVAEGVYFVRVQAQGRVDSQKLVLVRD
ncbi:MAG: S8 family serine peptidase [Candidatus Eisenbacteria bacterium]